MKNVANVLGVKVSAVNPASALATIERWITNGERHYVCVSGVHGLMECQRDRSLRRIHNRAGMVLPDGMPLAWWLWWEGHADTDRVCGPEFMPYVIDASQGKGYKHFLYGASEETLSGLYDFIAKNYPGAEVVGSHSPPFRKLTPEEDGAIVDEINISGADIVWVGLSTPKQEKWMAAHRSRLNAAVLLGVGAAFDINAGKIKRAPVFLRRTGCEWVYRLVLEPGRLWRRYLSNNPAFVVLAVAQLSHLHKFELDLDPASSGASGPMIG